MEVGGIFLHGWIHNQTAVPQGDNRFCSITIFHGEKNDFLLKMWCFGALPAHTKSTHKSKFLTAQNFPAHAALVQGLSLHKKGTHQVSGKSDTGCRKKQGRGRSMPPTIVFALKCCFNFDFQQWRVDFNMLVPWSVASLRLARP